MRRRALGEVLSIERYPRSHDLTRIPRDAATRLRIRLANHSTFTCVDVLGALKVLSGKGGVIGFTIAVPLLLIFTMRAFNCIDICFNIWAEVSAGSSDKPL